MSRGIAEWILPLIASQVLSQVLTLRFPRTIHTERTIYTQGTHTKDDRQYKMRSTQRTIHNNPTHRTAYTAHTLHILFKIHSTHSTCHASHVIPNIQHAQVVWVRSEWSEQLPDGEHVFTVRDNPHYTRIENNVLGDGDGSDDGDDGDGDGDDGDSDEGNRDRDDDGIDIDHNSDDIYDARNEKNKNKEKSKDEGKDQRKEKNEDGKVDLRKTENNTASAQPPVTVTLPLPYYTEDGVHQAEHTQDHTQDHVGEGFTVHLITCPATSATLPPEAPAPATTTATATATAFQPSTSIQPFSHASLLASSQPPTTCLTFDPAKLMFSYPQSHSDRGNGKDGNCDCDRDCDGSIIDDDVGSSATNMAPQTCKLIEIYYTMPCHHAIPNVITSKHNVYLMPYVIDEYDI